jgi:hypothetical protein
MNLHNYKLESENAFLLFRVTFKDDTLEIKTIDKTGMLTKGVEHLFCTSIKIPRVGSFTLCNAFAEKIHPVVMLIQTITFHIPSKIYFGIDPEYPKRTVYERKRKGGNGLEEIVIGNTMESRYRSKVDEAKQFYLYKLLLSVYGVVGKHEYNYDLGVGSNPVKLLNNAIEPPTVRLTIDMLKNAGVAVAGSAGKESSFIRDILYKLQIQYSNIFISDSFEERDSRSASPITLESKALLPTFSLNTLGSGFAYSAEESLDSFGTTIIAPIVPLRTAVALLSAVATDMDVLFFGSGAETHQLFRFDNLLYTPRSFLASQWFYNVLNNTGLFHTRLYAPIMNFTMPTIVNYLCKNGRKFNSCQNNSESWCGDCWKCKKTSWMVEELGHSIPELNLLTTDKGGSSRLFHAFIPKLIRRFDTDKGKPIFPELRKRIRTNQYVEDLSPIKHPLFTVWGENDFKQIEELVR